MISTKSIQTSKFFEFDQIVVKTILVLFELLIVNSSSNFIICHKSIMNKKHSFLLYFWVPGPIPLDSGRNFTHFAALDTQNCRL